MAKRFLTPTEFVTLSSDPDNGSAGQLYFNTTDGVFKYYDGESWKFFITESTQVYDGGDPNTFAFNNNIDGGDPFETIFIGIYDGGIV
jgi:hypothetical protein